MRDWTSVAARCVCTTVVVVWLGACGSDGIPSGFDTGEFDVDGFVIGGNDTTGGSIIGQSQGGEVIGQDQVGEVIGGTCGNGDLDDGEQCDGDQLRGETCSSLGEASGMLACRNCAFDTSMCGSGSDSGGSNG